MKLERVLIIVLERKNQKDALDFTFSKQKSVKAYIK